MHLHFYSRERIQNDRYQVPIMCESWASVSDILHNNNWVYISSAKTLAFYLDLFLFASTLSLHWDVSIKNTRRSHNYYTSRLQHYDYISISIQKQKKCAAVVKMLCYIMDVQIKSYFFISKEKNEHIMWIVRERKALEFVREKMDRVGLLFLSLWLLNLTEPSFFHV